MNPEQLFVHLKKLAEALSTKQILGLVSVFAAVVAVFVTSAYWLTAPNYTLLVSDMDAETASSVVSRLKAAKVPYQLDAGGRAVRVPTERADELRLEFASNGLPSAGRIGFEIFDRPAFGTTEFLEHVNYRRALEGELARTISTFSEVSSARVHIAMAKDSLFVDQEQSAKASVVLRLKANRPLSPNTVRGIAGLVSNSVESLRPEGVNILDTFGRSLTKPAEDESDAAAGPTIERQRQMERDLSTRVVALLEPVVGVGRVRVNVSAHLRSDIVEQTEEQWDPTTVLRSRQLSTEVASSTSGAGGAAGTRANLPPPMTAAAGAAAASATPPAAGAAATPSLTPAVAAATPAAAAVVPMTGPGRSAETTNYEVSKTTRHTVSPQGQLARLSVAVLIDDEHVTTQVDGQPPATTTKPRDAADMENLQKLVAASVGLDQTRGDHLMVANISFETAVEESAPPAPKFTAQALDLATRSWPGLLRYGVILGLAFFTLFGVLRPLARRAGSLAQAQALPAPAGAARLPTVSEMENQMEAPHNEKPGGAPLPALTKRVAKLANDEPEQLARIVRGWMAEEHR